MKSFSTAFTGILMSLLSLFLSFRLIAQQSSRTITAAEQRQVIDKAFVLLNAHYIFPDVVPGTEKVVYQKLANGTYAKFTTAEDFLRNLNADLETESGDRHIDVFYDPVRVKQIEAEAGNKNNGKPAYAPPFLQRARYENYMLRKAERLDGNVGYLKFNAFVDTALAKPTLVAAMNFLRNSSALIIDLRQNGGGDARTCNFLLGYFLPDSTLLMQRRTRTEKRLTNVYLVKDDAVQKFDKGLPLYILTSKRTSSAAEAFAYTLQSYKRATVVGDTTNGEANPGYLFSLNSEMYIMIPAFENINPVTQTAWQGKGVMPDVSAVAEKALPLAQALAYEKLSSTTAVKEQRAMYDWMATGLRAEVSPPALAEKDLNSYAGSYADNRKISVADGVLFYERTGSTATKRKLLLLKENLYGVEGLPFFRIRFVKNEKGEVTGLIGLYDDGKEEASKKL